MERRYTSYGLSIAVDGSIPGLVPSASTSEPDVRIHIGSKGGLAGIDHAEQWYQSPSPNRLGRPNLTISRVVKGGFHFQYDDQIEFLVASTGDEVWCDWSAPATLDDAAVYLRGPILGFVLRLRGMVCLHASAIGVDATALAIVAPAGGGKSTTAASFAKLGFPVLSDDVVTLVPRGDELMVTPGYPRVNLWPDAAKALYGTADLSRMTPATGINDWWDKRFADLELETEFCTESLPLGAIYIMDDRTLDPVISIEPLTQRDAFVWLTDGTSVNYALDEAMRATEFEILGRLIRSVPVKLVLPPKGHDRLPELCRAILDDFSQLNQHAHV